jgi:hypothetical protein
MQKELKIDISTFRKALVGRFMYSVDRTDLCDLCVKTDKLQVKYANNPAALQKLEQQEAYRDRLIHRTTNVLIRKDFNISSSSGRLGTH